jgi:hypothetical protein
MAMRTSSRTGAILAGMIAGGTFAFPVSAIQAAEPAKPAISQEASAALLRMGQTLRAAEQFSFQANRIRVYSEANGEPLHIFHTIKVTVHRPNRLLGEVTEDDGSEKLFFDGKTLTLFSAAEKKYVRIPIPEGTIEGMMKEAVGRIGVDFPIS